MRLTEKQEQANSLLGSAAQHVLLYGGSRSGKTFLMTRAIVFRALAASKSRHAILRFRFNAVKASIVSDTFPKVMDTCFPGAEWKLDKQDCVAHFPNGSQVWFGGLDDKERVEKILGMEFATIMLNECSQIPKASRDIAVTRLAQNVMVDATGLESVPLRRKMFYDENPPNKGHWTYRMFVEHRDPDTKEWLHDPQNYACMQVNPTDNAANLPSDYLATLEGLSGRLQKRFLRGEFADSNPNALFNDVSIDKWRVLDKGLPDLQRIVIGVDPSGSGDKDNADNDAIGICVCALGIDGNVYVLEDATVKAGPTIWGRIVASAFDRHGADIVVGEGNYGGAMVQHVIQTARPKTPFKMVTATRGKTVRAEPFAPLYDDGRIRHVGYLRDLEDELVGFSTVGYTGQGSPNRADALIWALSELFPGMVSGRKDKPVYQPKMAQLTGGWHG